jgi:hypothetical protein
MARQEDSCWRCGAVWASHGAPALRLIPGEGGDHGAEVTLPVPATAAAR